MTEKLLKATLNPNKQQLFWHRAAAARQVSWKLQTRAEVWSFVPPVIQIETINWAKIAKWHVLPAWPSVWPEPKAHTVSLYSIPMVRHPSVWPSVFHTFKLEYHRSQLANPDHILCVASLEWGKGCKMFWGRLDQNSGFHGNGKPSLTYNGENDVTAFSRLFLIGSFLYLQVTWTCIKSQMNLNFRQVGALTTELAVLEHLKNFP